ncbi:MAG: HEAT repeat domain-containing protein [Planctomycetota bacterium]|nr:HEAT repeat domain-containing protein [Planctomycetota bacterium]
MAFFDFLKPKWQRSDPEVRKAGISSLEDQTLLDRISRTDEDPSVQEAASRRLQTLMERHVKGLANTVRNGDDDREQAVKTLVNMHSDDAARALFGALDGTIGQRWTGRTFVLPEMLAELGEAGIGVMSAVLEREGTEPDLQSAIAKAMETIGSHRPEAIRALVRALGRESETFYFVRERAARALGRVGPAASTAIPALVRNLAVPDKHNRDGVCAAAEDALKSIGPDAIPHVLTLLSDPERKSRAIRILQHLNVCEPSLFEPMLQTWKQSEKKDPILLRYLVQISPEKAGGILREALESDQQAEVGGETLYLDAVAAQIVVELQSSKPGLGSDLAESVKRAAARLVAGLEKDIPAPPANCNLSARITRLAYYGPFARPFAGRVESIAKATQNDMTAISLSALLACIADDPRPHIKYLCGIMRAADAGHGMGMAGVIGYMSAWSAFSPAMAAQKSLDKIAAIMGRRIAPVLREIRSEYPDRIDKCLEAIEKATPNKSMHATK